MTTLKWFSFIFFKDNQDGNYKNAGHPPRKGTLSHNRFMAVLVRLVLRNHPFYYAKYLVFSQQLVVLVFTRPL